MNYPFLFEHITWKPPTPCEGIILRDLLDNDGLTTKERLIFQLYGHDPDGGPLCADNCLNAFIFHLKHKLIPGWTINRYWGRIIVLNETLEI